jgi:hypothetical protein
MRENSPSPVCGFDGVRIATCRCVSGAHALATPACGSFSPGAYLEEKRSHARPDYRRRVPLILQVTSVSLSLDLRLALEQLEPQKTTRRRRN